MLVDRIFTITDRKGRIVQEGIIKAPSCIKVPALNVEKLTKQQRAIYNGEAVFSDLSHSIISSHISVNEEEHYVYDYVVNSVAAWKYY